MDSEAKTKIYDRLLEIRVVFEPETVPRPAFINEKIWECHRLIEEVERVHIEITKEMSVLQRSLNDTTAEYQSKKEECLMREDIRQLPSIKDREAKANQSLKEELDRIKTLENELSSLNNLLRAVDLKMKNLNRLNADIRLQVRVLEQQVRLNSLPQTNPIAADLVAEMNKTSAGEDSFKNAESSVEEQNVIDPSSPLDIEDILQDGESDMDIESMIDPVPDVDPESRGEDAEDVFGDQTSSIDLDKVLENDESGDNAGPDIESNPTEQEPENTQGGEQSIIEPDPDQKTDSGTQNGPGSAGIDIDDLLDNIIQKERAS